MMSRSKPERDLTLKQLEQVVATLAYIVIRHGEKYAPLFDKMQQALLRKQQECNATERAQAYLEKLTLVQDRKSVASFPKLSYV